MSFHGKDLPGVLSVGITQNGINPESHKQWRHTTPPRHPTWTTKGGRVEKRKPWAACESNMLS
eukprot:286044-Karenia_brevis.AAC.1